MKAIRYEDALTHRSWLEFSSKPEPEVIGALKATGWRWSGYRKAWHNARRNAPAPTSFEVEVEDGGKVEWAAERADRLEARAGNAMAESERRLGAAQRLGDSIPFGQPILVGHHSEGRARRDAERIHNGFQKGFEAMSKANHLTAAASSSRAHQAHLQDPGTIARRIDKMKAELRKLERTLSNPRPVWLQEEIVTQRARIEESEAELAAVGGLKTDIVNPGDLILIRGHAVRVIRVNAKTYSGVIEGGGANGMSGKWDKSWFKKVLQTNNQEANHG